ncbi:MAG TPA: MFS transporter [Terriglobales bacterium]|jgi:MFS family permease|nr:MFS transporter [Terriglobales bacterium]
MGSGARVVVVRSGFPFATTIVLVLLCLMYGITYIDRVNVSTASLVFKQDLHLTNAQVGLVFSAFAYPYVFFTTMGGWLSDRFGARRALTVSALIWGGATLVTGMTTTLGAMLAARAVLGFGEGATFPIATRAMCEWLPERRRAFAQGITHSSSRLGTAVTPPLVAWLIALITWRGSFVVLGSVSLAWALAWALYFRDNPADHFSITAKELESLPPFVSRDRKADPVPWLSLARRMLPVTVVYFCYGWTLWLYLAWIPSFFLHSYRLDVKNSALFSSGVFFAGVVGDTLGGVVSDRILLKTGDRIMARRNLVVAGFLCSMQCMLLIFFVRSVSAAAICLSLGFFFAEFTIGPMWAIPMDIAPQFSGSASGLMNIGSPLAAIVSPLVFGYVIDKTGNWNLPFLGSISILLIGSVLAFWMRPEKGFRT